MPPSSEADRQKLLMQQEIAKLSGAITRHSSGATGPPTRSHPYARGSGNYRGMSRGRGRGRGSGYSLDLRTAGASTYSNAPARQDPHSGPVTWVKNTQSRAGNISIMTKEKSAQLQAKPAQERQSVRATRDGQQIVIDGVIFQFEQGGAKLSRVGEAASTSTPTRRRVNYGGNRYRRTSRGNLVQSAKRSTLEAIPCRYYTKTGRCNRALTCPYAHIPGRLAICPRFLRSSCEASPCPLSHQPSAHNTPSCLRFQAASTCRLGETCVYPHVRVASDAAVCEAFARGGWCDRDPGACPDLHVWECGEFREKGKCSRGGRCGLRHILRAVTNDEAPGDSAGGGFEDNADYVDLDHGSPPGIDEGDDEFEDDNDASDTSEDDDGDDHDDDVLKNDGEGNEDDDGITFTHLSEYERDDDPGESVSGESEGTDSLVVH